MPVAVAVSHITGPRERHGPSAWPRVLVAALLPLCVSAVPAQSQQALPPVEVIALSATRSADAVSLDYQLRVTLPPTVEDAARRGVPLYFVATATLWRPRWYWRDARIARERREWRLSYQPLTSTWRVSQGGLGQSHPTLEEAMALMTRSTEWRLADASQAEADGKNYVEFEWSLDTTQLPRPLQIGVTGIGGRSDWALRAQHTMKLEAAPGATPPQVNASPRSEPR